MTSRSLEIRPSSEGEWRALELDYIRTSRCIEWSDRAPLGLCGQPVVWATRCVEHSGPPSADEEREALERDYLRYSLCTEPLSRAPRGLCGQPVVSRGTRCEQHLPLGGAIARKLDGGRRRSDGRGD